MLTMPHPTRPRWLLWMTLAVLLAGVLYVASIGPVWRVAEELRDAIYGPPVTGFVPPPQVISVIYWPLFFIAGHSQSFAEALFWYCGLFWAEG